MRVFCKDCRFWEGTELDGKLEPLGLCRRYAPKPRLWVTGADFPMYSGLWPETHKTDSCGEGEL